MGRLKSGTTGGDCAGAVYGCTAVNQFSIPASVQKLQVMSLGEFRACLINWVFHGKPCFSESSNLETVSFCVGLVVDCIARRSFARCPSLRSIILQSSVQILGEGYFSQCCVIPLSSPHCRFEFMIPRSRFVCH
jgi:hypothetical protein